MHVEHAGSRQVYLWTHVIDVIDGPSGLLVLVDLMGYQPIPSGSLPDGVEKDQLKAQIKALIEDARS